MRRKEYRLRNLSWKQPANQHALISQFSGDYDGADGQLVEQHSFKLTRTHKAERPRVPSRPC